MFRKYYNIKYLVEFTDILKIHRVRYPDFSRGFNFRSRSRASVESRENPQLARAGVDTVIGSIFDVLTIELVLVRKNHREKIMSRVLLLFLCALLGFVYGATVKSEMGDTCQPDKLTVYKVVLHTFWSRESFPKHYPDWRPPASWSKVFGKFINCPFSI